MEKYSLDLPQIRKDEISVDQREVNIDVSHRFDYGFKGYEPREVPGLKYEAHLRFTGDKGLSKPSQASGPSTCRAARCASASWYIEFGTCILPLSR